MERFLDIHMFITAALQKTDMRAVALQLAMDLLYKKVKMNSSWVQAPKPESRNCQNDSACCIKQAITQ